MAGARVLVCASRVRRRGPRAYLYPHLLYRMHTPLADSERLSSLSVAAAPPPTKHLANPRPSVHTARHMLSPQRWSAAGRCSFFSNSQFCSQQGTCREGSQHPNSLFALACELACEYKRLLRLPFVHEAAWCGEQVWSRQGGIDHAHAHMHALRPAAAASLGMGNEATIPYKPIIFCDLDGTLLDSQCLLASLTVEALAQYQGGGGIVCFITGRSLGALGPALR